MTEIGIKPVKKTFKTERCKIFSGEYKETAVLWTNKTTSIKELQTSSEFSYLHPLNSHTTLLLCYMTE